MSKYEELKYVLSGATDWGYEYAKKEDVEAAFAELEERHAMELDQWVLELGKTKLENERLKKDIDTLKTAWEQSQSALSTIAALKLAAEEKLRASRMALWLSRAKRAGDRAITCNDFVYLGDTERNISMTLARTWMKCRLLKPSEWSKVWNNVERKCRAKVEEYKEDK